MVWSHYLLLKIVIYATSNIYIYLKKFINIANHKWSQAINIKEFVMCLKSVLGLWFFVSSSFSHVIHLYLNYFFYYSFQIFVVNYN